VDLLTLGGIHLTGVSRAIAGELLPEPWCQTRLGQTFRSSSHFCAGTSDRFHRYQSAIAVR
jgi:hypothetical protein